MFFGLLIAATSVKTLNISIKKLKRQKVYNKKNYNRTSIQKKSKVKTSKWNNFSVVFKIFSATHILLCEKMREGMPSVHDRVK